MTWDKFMELNKIGPRYKHASLQGISLVRPELLNSGISWAKNPSNSLILSGDTGRGKTHFLVSLMHEMIKNGVPLHSMRFFKSKNLEDKLFDVGNSGNDSYLLRCICEIPFLFLDDFGVERPTERAKRDMFEIIDTRLEWNRVTVISTNLKEKDIASRYEKRIHSRMKEYAWLKFEGEDLRGTPRLTRCA